MEYNEKTRQLEGNVEVTEKGTAEKTIENIIWGESELKPEK